MNVTYSSSDTLLHIGSTMTVYMTAVQPVTPVSVSVTGTPSFGSLTLSFAALPSTNDLYVTDGTKTWRSLGVSSGTTSIVLSDGLLFNSGPVSGGDYTLLANATFRAYLGPAVTSASGSPALVAEIGSFDSLALSDPFASGAFTGSYFVRDLGFTISSGHLFGSAICNGLLAQNAPFQSTVSFELDGVRPQIDHFTSLMSNPNYSGCIYLSSRCQNGLTPGQVGYVQDPTNGWARFDVTTNKRSVTVGIVIKNSGGVTIKTLPPILIPSNAVGNNGFRVWNGDNDNGSYVYDGDYTAYFNITDTFGVQGTTRTAKVKVVSMRMDIVNISASPSRLVSDATGIVNSTVNVSYQVELKNDTNTDISSSLGILGFTGPFSSPTDFESSIFSRSSMGFIDANGVQAYTSSQTSDFHPTDDEDEEYLNYFRNDPSILNNMAQCYLGTGGNVSTFGSTVLVADGSAGNDDSGLAGFVSKRGAPTFIYGPLNSANPPLLTASKNFDIELVNVSASSFGSARVRITEILTHLKMFSAGQAASSVNFPSPCTPTGSDFYIAQPVRFEGVDSLVSASDVSVVISAVTANNPTLDTTAPTLLSANPADNSAVSPFVYGPTSPLSYSVQDTESGVDASGVSTITVKDPTGAFVAGIASSNGGTAFNSATISFAPFAPLTLGGTYTVELKACNTAGLCFVREFSFAVRDQTAPAVTGEEIVRSNVTGSTALSLFQTSPDGPFDSVTEVWASIGMPSTSTNSIVWDNCTISLEQVSGTARIPVPSTRISPAIGTAPVDGKIKYRLVDPITTAGLYEIVVQTLAKDASGTTFAGPTGFTQLRFSTIINPNALNIRYTNGQLALSGTLPISVQGPTGTFSASNSDPAARRPDFTTLAANPGYTALSTASGNSALIFTRGGVPITSAMTWDFPTTTSLRATLYYNDSDLPTGVISSDLQPFGYTGTSWAPISSATYTSTLTNVSNNAYLIDLPDQLAAYSAFALFYPSVNNNAVALSTPTALAFKDTRSFNPAHSNAIYRKARFYYGSQSPKEVEVRIFDANGVLVRQLSLGNGVNALDMTTDPVYGGSAYYFEWDGRNDSGTLVRNGIYLARWRVTRMDNTTETAVKPVALIK